MSNQKSEYRLKDTYSAALIAENEFSPSPMQGQVEHSQSTSLIIENSVSGQEVRANHEGNSAAAPVPNPEKWSYEAIVARSNLRQNVCRN